MKLATNKCYMLVKKGGGEELIFLLSIDYVRTVNGKNRFTLNYSEVYGYIETCIDFEDIDYIYPVPIDETIKNRLIQKWGKAEFEKRLKEN